MHIRELFDLTGRVAVVTGGAGLYGKPICEALAEAGATVILASRDEDDVSKWDESMAANARGIFIMCRAFGDAMAEEGRGSIINVSSVYGIVAPDNSIYEGLNMGTEPDYPYTKGGMVAYTRYLASHYAYRKRGVRVNCVIP